MFKYIGILALSMAAFSFAADWQAKSLSTNAANLASTSDQQIANKIREKIGSSFLSKSLSQLSVQVNNGFVTLSGSVKTYSDKEAVEREVRSIEGVKQLNSQISVTDPESKGNHDYFTQDSAGTPADEQLNKKIRDVTSRGWLWNSNKEVALSTNNGIVTLNGYVRDADQQQKLIGEIKKVEGVKQVISNLKIKNP